jgi:trk system potassium uptake protein TrkH
MHGVKRDAMKSDSQPRPSGRHAAPLAGPGLAWTLRAANVLAPALALGVVLAHHGFPLAGGAALAVSAAEAGLGAFFALRTIVGFFWWRRPRLFFRERAGELAVLGLCALALGLLLAAEGWMPNWESLGPVVEIYLGLNILLALLRAERAFLRLRVRPIHVFVLSFELLIGFGAVLLYFLPRATRNPGSLSFLDALFTATSASCVTGLAVVDTGTTYTRLGQAILAFLIQSGGLGIMIFAAFVGLALGKGMGLRERAIMKSSLNLEFAGDMGRLVLFILAATFGIEAAGALLIYSLGVGDACREGPAWFAVFHAVSAFCNAGFGLDPDSLEQYAGNAAFLAVIMALIVLGGLGFVVIRDLRALPGWLPRPARAALVRWRLLPPGRPPRPSLHSWIVLSVSGLLLAAGTAGFAALEWKGVLGDSSFGQALLSSLFQSVSARTAGFNSVPFGVLATPTLILIICLMFVGASPGSTGGGIKTSTFAILVLNVWRTFRGRADVEIRGRRIPSAVVERAMVLAFVSAGLVFTSIFILSVLEPRIPLEKLAFEVVSALATVGLSTGITPELSELSKAVLIVLMMVGRLGPMTLVWALGTEAAKANYAYPEERVVIG